MALAYNNRGYVINEFTIENPQQTRLEALKLIDAWFNKYIFKYQDIEPLPFDFFESKNGSVF